MEKYLKPDKFSANPLMPNPDSPTSGKEFTHWLKTFENFVAPSTEPLNDDDKLKVLANFLSFSVYELISECTTYEDAIKTLKDVLIKPKGEIFARHLLAVRKQKQGEGINQYIQALKLLGKDFDFKPVTAEEHKNQYIRDSFINGLLSPQIRQRILEETKTLSLEEVIQRAQALELAQKQADGYTHGASDLACAGTSAIPSCVLSTDKDRDCSEDVCAGMRAGKNKCYFCGFDRHPRSSCPALESECRNCLLKGHYARCIVYNVTAHSCMCDLATANRNLFGMGTSSVRHYKLFKS
nr:uncharacterized protein LOC112210843 [Halyomorpha halys]